MKLPLLFLLVFFLLPPCVNAVEDLPLPRFVSIKSGDANIRTGPGRRYPVKWQITRKNVPVEVLTEFEQWRKIRDISGDEGWVHQSMLSGARFVIVESSQLLRKSDSQSSRAVAKLESGVSARLKTCTNEWCEVEVNDVSGWVLRSGLWGIHAHETLHR